ncbi:transmembrane signal receptor [Lithospermum erythrorhizon]|uniref:Transmembrane signal receptor n=1 Tax=Lithospermum erythrorhizon TaxID=34254 RepID=A0AAV3QSY9_LITER
MNQRGFVDQTDIVKNLVTPSWVVGNSMASPIIGLERDKATGGVSTATTEATAGVADFRTQGDTGKYRYNTTRRNTDPQLHQRATGAVPHTTATVGVSYHQWSLMLRCQNRKNSIPQPIQEPDPETESTQNDLDIPITLRKGTSIRLPVEKFMAYTNLSPNFQDFIASLSDIVNPRDVREALQIPEWRDAVLEEMKALEKNQTWILVNLLPKKKAVCCKWIFTVKYNEDGKVDRYKVRLVAKDFTQTYGIDFSKTFAPIAKLNTVRILLSLTVNLEWELHQLDIKNIF